MSKEVQSMFSRIAHRYDITNDVLSFGIHRYWRRKALRLASIAPEELVVDLCTGTGDFALEAAKRVGPKGTVCGLDFVQSMISLARTKQNRIYSSVRKSQSPVHFILGDAARLPFPDNSADAVTIAFGIRNVDNPTHCLREIKRILKKSGRVIVLEFGQPKTSFFSFLFNMYSRWLMPLLGGCLTGDKRAYEYLPRTSREFPSDQKFLELLTEAGFQSSSAKAFFNGVSYLYIAYK